jgi:TIR domain-containing protein
VNSIELRIYRKALSNELAIAVGESLSNFRFGIPQLGAAIRDKFGVDFTVNHPDEFYRLWNEFVDAAEAAASRVKVAEFVAGFVEHGQPQLIHHAIAQIPVSNFIDTTFDRVFLRALLSAGRRPLLHDWNTQRIGAWRQTNPETPNVFFMLPAPDPSNPWWGVHNLTLKGENIQITNISEMMSGRDLLLLDYPAEEAEWVLNLPSLAAAGEKIFDYSPRAMEAAEYWPLRGVLVRTEDPNLIVNRLLPSEAGSTRYDGFDSLFGRSVLDIDRLRQYDAFMSYFSGDADFAKRVQSDLHLRGLRLWRDEHEIEIGDSLSQRIEEGLKKSYSMIIVLSPEALSRPWVNEELRAGYARRLAEKFKIFPVLHKECELPPLLADYRYADFRDPSRYEESLSLLERAIRNAVSRARDKK